MAKIRYKIRVKGPAGTRVRKTARGFEVKVPIRKRPGSTTRFISR